jgi:CheY-like chemotaxis protein
VNLGKLGFLAEIDVPDLPDALAAIEKHDFTIEPRLAVDCTWKGGQEMGGATVTAFNDIAAVRTPGDGSAAIELMRANEAIDLVLLDATLPGVPSRDVFMDHAGFNTYDSMFRARDVFGVESLIISTQEFHISRSVYIARTMGIEAYGYPCEDRYAVKSNRFRESFARVKAFWDTAVKRSPKFLGETIPISGSGDATAG